MSLSGPMANRHGFTAAVAHVANDNPQVQVGGVALALSGDGVERCLELTVRHADGTGLVVYLSDNGMGRLGDLVTALYGAAVVRSATKLGTETIQ